MTHEARPVVLLPGGVLPAQPAYEALLAELGDQVDARAKDLEMYAGEAVPPAGYSLETEVEGILRTAADAGFEAFHLVGYSAGGASSLAFAARHPERLRSLALLEPAWAGRGPSAEEAVVYEQLRSIADLPPDQVMPTFVKLQLAPGVDPPPPRPGHPTALDGLTPRRDARLSGRPGCLGARFRRTWKVHSSGLLRVGRSQQP